MRFALASLALAGWVAALALLLAPGSSHRRRAGQAGTPTIITTPGAPATRTPRSAPRARPRRLGRAANNTTPAEADAGPPPARNPQATRLIARWLRAYLRWQLHPTAVAPLRTLRAASTAALFRSITARAPTGASATGHAQPTLAGVAVFEAPEHGFSATADLVADGTEEAVEVDAAPTVHGLRVTSIRR